MIYRKGNGIERVGGGHYGPPPLVHEWAAIFYCINGIELQKSQKENQAEDLAVVEGVLARIRFLKHLFISIYMISLQDAVKAVLPAVKQNNSTLP